MDKFQFGVSLAASRLLRKNVPFQVNIHLNDACNLRCRYCYIDFDHASDDFPLPGLKKVLTECREMGTVRVSLEGGEPLLRRDIGEIVDFVRDLGMECNMNTNGYLYPKLAGRLKRLSLLSVSLDGDEDAHDRMRGKGSFQKALEAVRCAKERGVKVHVLCVLNKNNVHSLDYLLDLAASTGFGLVPNTAFFSPDGDRRDREREKEYALSDEEHRAVLEKLARRKGEGAPVVWSLETLRYVARWPFSYGKSNMWRDEMPKGADWKPVQCLAGRYYCVIQTNGNVYTCDPMLGHGPTANCLELGFKEAFRRLSIGDCVACTSLVLTEYHQLFNLHPAVVLNMVRNYGRG